MGRLVVSALEYDAENPGSNPVEGTYNFSKYFIFALQVGYFRFFASVAQW